MQVALQNMAQQLNVPLSHTSSIVVPTVTGPRKTAICRVLRRILRSTGLKAWQRQAYFQLIRLVRSSPQKLHTVFDRSARNADLQASESVCHCHEMEPVLRRYGAVCDTEGHLPLVSIHVWTPSGRDLRPRNPLPINGLKAREIAIKAIHAFAKQVNGTVLDLSSSLPTCLFPETGADLKYVQSVVRETSGVIYVRIVDKGPGELWGFCRAWVWDIVWQFLETEGYQGNFPHRCTGDRTHERHRQCEGLACKQQGPDMPPLFNRQGEKLT